MTANELLEVISKIKNLNNLTINIEDITIENNCNCKEKSINKDFFQEIPQENLK